MDNPGNSWVFGEEGELFEQKLVGSHTIQSGFTSIISAEAFDELQSDSQDAVRLKLPTWEQFKRIVHDDDVTWPHPQLQPLIIFAGHMIESDIGSVYQNPASGSNIAGLTISTNSEEVDCHPQQSLTLLLVQGKPWCCCTSGSTLSHTCLVQYASDSS